MAYIWAFLSVLGVLWQVIAWRRGGASAIIAYALTAVSLSLLMFVVRQEGLALLYVFCALGFLPVLLCADRDVPADKNRTLRATDRRLFKTRILAASSSAGGVLLSCLFVILAVGFFTIVRGISPTSFSTTPMSLTTLLVKRGHSLEMVGLFLILFLLVYGLVCRRDDDHGQRHKKEYS